MTTSSGTRRLCLTVLALILAMLAAVSAGTPDRGEPGTPDPREAELLRIRREIEGLQKRLADTRNRQEGLGGELQRTRLELELQESQLAEATAALELAAARATAAEAKVEELKVALAGTRKDLRRRLHGLYRLGRQGYVRLFLSLEPGENLLPAIRQLRFLVRRDQISVERFVATREELAEQRLHLEAQHQAMAQWQQQETERRDGLVRLRRRQERLLAQLEAERKRLASRTDALQEKELKLVRLINSLASESSLSGTPIQDFRGVLDWPAPGEIVGRFGPRRDPRYNTEVPHSGIDMIVESPEVRAVYPGEVLFAAHFEGYGQMVVVHHAGRVFTLYAKLSELRVEKGDVVSLGAVLGAADELYFEIRHENQAEDPLLWLR
jgi:septal ring factor EnvC (AmiA/AmiB activator)